MTKPKRRGNHEGSIQQLPSGSWRAQISIHGKRESATFQTRKDAETWNRQMARQIDDGYDSSRSKVFLEEYLQNWLASSKAMLAARTWEHYEQLARTHILPDLGKCRLSELRTEHIQKTYDRLILKGVGAPTVSKIHVFLRRVLDHAVKTEVIRRNPANAAMPPRKQHKEMQILDEEQVDLLLICAMDSRLETLLRLAIYTGMREMEILGLKWSDLNVSRRTIKIERQLARSKSGKDVFAPLKTRSSRRTIELGEPLIASLNRQRERLQAEKEAAGDKWQDFDLIFPTNLGTPMHPRNLLRDFKRLLAKAGLPERRFHDLRHTTASLLLANNIPVVTVSKILGHANTSTTLNTYSHWVPGTQYAAVEVMDRITTPVKIPSAFMPPNTEVMTARPG